MTVPFSEWESEWKEKYQGQQHATLCFQEMKTSSFFAIRPSFMICVPKVATLGLQRRKKDTLQKVFIDNL